MINSTDDQALLGAFCKAFIERDIGAYERALARYMTLDRRFLDGGTDHARFFQYVERIGERLKGGTTAAAALGCDEPTAAALGRAFERLASAQPTAEEAFAAIGVMPELVARFAHELGLFRDDYEAFLAALPRLGEYRPLYMNAGPSGRCNLTCPSCILWGALFAGEGDGQGVTAEAFQGHLDDAERLELATGISFCIGEPTMHLRRLDAALDRIRASESLYVRSFITNGLHGRTVEGARRVWQRVLEHLGSEKSERCLFAISANPELTEQGVTPVFAANAVAAFDDVMPNGHVFVQLIRDEGHEEHRDAVIAELVALGKLDAGAVSGDGGLGRGLKSGKRLVFSGMAKMPPIGSPEGEVSFDPWVGYLDPGGAQPMPGLFMGSAAGLPEDEADAGDDASRRAERIALAPDGQFYVDYHFMVRRARPLGRTLPDAVQSFEHDPILVTLKRRGGLDIVMAAHDSLPDGERPLPSLRAMAGRYATTSMAAANLVFSDDDLALRVARRLVEAARQ